jgi:histidyl-tRNA synthetase
MDLSTQPYRGARDFYPEDMRVQKYIFTTWRRVCERFGYEEYMTPMLESTDIYLAKTSEEIVREQTYTFNDRGNRSVTMRPEMTPSLARMVAGRRQELGYPARMYSIANFWRYERAQRGRLREFWQLNADIFGIEGIAAEHECISLADQILQEFGAKRSMYEIRINSRKFINYMLTEYLGFSDVETQTLVRLIDKIDKMSKAEFVALAEAAVRPAKREDGSVTKLMDILSSKDPSELPKDLAASETLDGLGELMTMLEKDGVTNAKFDIKLMRGFDYYTDIVFEAFDTHPDNNRAMFGGGRYDGLVANFGVEPVPTFGFAPGDVSTQLFLESHELMPKFVSETDLYVVLAGVEYPQVLRLVASLRKEGLNVAVDVSGKKIGAQIKTAEKKNITNIIVVGEEELKSNRFKLKNIVSGVEEELAFERLVVKLMDKRNK